MKCDTDLSVLELTSDHSYLSLSQAAKISPGRPSTNCIWRWCRKGVQARSGERIKLQHIRVGGKIFTTQEWVEKFGRKLAEADAAHFDRAHLVTNGSARANDREDHLRQIDQQLREAGL